RFEQGLTILKQLQVNPITVPRHAARINVQREVFACGEPFCLSGLERFARLSNNFELIIPKRSLQRAMKAMHWPRRDSRRIRSIGGDAQAAPNPFARARGRWRHA